RVAGVPPAQHEKIYTAFRSVSTLSEPRLTADSPLHVWQRATASLRRSRKRLWNVSHRPPIPTALLPITTESVPAGTARSVAEEAASRSDRVTPLFAGDLGP